VRSGRARLSVRRRTQQVVRLTVSLYGRPQRGRFRKNVVRVSLVLRRFRDVLRGKRYYGFRTAKGTRISFSFRSTNAPGIVDGNLGLGRGDRRVVVGARVRVLPKRKNMRKRRRNKTPDFAPRRYEYVDVFYQIIFMFQPQNRIVVEYEIKKLKTRTNTLDTVRISLSQSRPEIVFHIRKTLVVRTADFTYCGIYART